MSINSRRRAENPGAAAVGSLIPWAAFVIALAVVDAGRDHRSGSLGRLAAVAPVYVGFVALPCLLPLLAARTGAGRLAVLVVMTAVAATSAVNMATSDDAQAGLAVLLVPYVAIPLAVVVWAGEAVAARRVALPHTEPLGSATASDRLAALAIDVAILGAFLLFPLTAMSRAKHEVAAGLVGVAAGTAYMGALVAVRRHTVGQSLLRLVVVDATSLERVGPIRATSGALSSCSR